MMRPIVKGSTDQSVVIRIVDSADGTPETGVVFNTSGIDLWYRREGATKTSITEATLSALNDAHSDGGILHIGDGYYRLDLPDAAVATGANGVAVGGTVTGMVVIGTYVPLIDFDIYSAVRAAATVQSFTIVKDATSQTVDVMITNSATGAGLTGLVYNASGLAAYYRRGATGTETVHTLATQTVGGAWSSGGLVEIDATNAPGKYRLDVLNAVLATGVDRASIHLKGAANMAPCVVNIELVDSITVTSGAVTVLSSTVNTMRKNTALANYPFKMVDATDLKTPETGVTVTAERMIDGGTFAACANAVTEDSLGWYHISLATTDLNGDTIVLKFTGTGCATTEHVIITQPT